MATTTETAAPVATGATAAPEVTEERKPMEHIAIICSKGTLDMAYPGLILANAARMSGIDATLFFTFWGLDIVNEKKIDHLHLNMVGNPSAPVPAMIAGMGASKKVPVIDEGEYDNIYIVSIPWFGKTKTIRLRYGAPYVPAE